MLLADQVPSARYAVVLDERARARRVALRALAARRLCAAELAGLLGYSDAQGIGRCKHVLAALVRDGLARRAPGAAHKGAPRYFELTDKVADS